MNWAHRQRFDIGGLPAVQAGAGPNVLLLHGVGLRAEAWGAQLDALARSAWVTAPDMPGHGESRVIASQMRLADYTDAAMAVLDALEGPAVVVGHSMGAMIALDLAARAPERVRGVAALNAVFERSAAAAAAVQARAAVLDGRTHPDPSATLERWFGSEPSPERDACHGWLGSVNPAAYKLAYTAFAHSPSPSRRAVAQLACPALFMTGRLEPNSTPAMSQAMAGLAPRGRARIIEGAAHMMPMTHPKEVNAALTGFLNEVQP
ncbi:MAG: alpha/beta hydrolase [Paracoccaceae bacterium]